MVDTGELSFNAIEILHGTDVANAQVLNREKSAR
jgi:hypothetical protein